MIFAMSSISLLGSLVWGHHIYTLGLETDTRAYFTGVTILISLPTGTKIFNWLSTYLGNPSFFFWKISSAFFGLLFLFSIQFLGSYSNYKFIISFSIFNRMGFWRTLSLQSNIEEVLSLSFSIPISSLWF